jgi:hypothetical protein
VRVVASEALGKHGTAEDQKEALRQLIELARADRSNVWVTVMALNAINHLQPGLQPSREAIEALPKDVSQPPPRMGGYVPRLIEKILADLT